MSKFITILTTEIQSVLEMLPAKSHIHEVKLNESKRAVEIVWENPNLKTPYTFPVPYSLTHLSSCELPPNVKDVGVYEKAAPQVVAPVATETPKSTVDKVKKKR